MREKISKPAYVRKRERKSARPPPAASASCSLSTSSSGSRCRCNRSIRSTTSRASVPELLGPLRLAPGRRGPSTSRIRRPRFRASRGGRARGRSSRRSARGTSSTSAARGALQASSLHRRPDPKERLALRVVEEPLRERRVPPRVSHASELGRAGRGPRRLCSSHGVATKLQSKNTRN